MIHSGGHVTLPRKDIRPRQTQFLLDNGVPRVSVDYRLCREATISEGPFIDVSNAYAWVIHALPSLNLTRTSTKLGPGRAVVIGWSTGHARKPRRQYRGGYYISDDKLGTLGIPDDRSGMEVQ
jgi:hypothetical protein